MSTAWKSVFYLSMALVAGCSNPEADANRKFVEIAQRLEDALKTGDIRKRHDLLAAERDQLDALLKDLPDSTAAARIVSGEKIGPLSRQELVGELKTIEDSIPYCLAQAGRECLKNMIHARLNDPSYLAKTQATEGIDMREITRVLSKLSLGEPVTGTNPQLIRDLMSQKGFPITNWTDIAFRSLLTEPGADFATEVATRALGKSVPSLDVEDWLAVILFAQRILDDIGGTPLSDDQRHNIVNSLSKLISMLPGSAQRTSGEGSVTALLEHAYSTLGDKGVDIMIESLPAEWTTRSLGSRNMTLTDQQYAKLLGKWPTSTLSDVPYSASKAMTADIRDRLLKATSDDKVKAHIDSIFLYKHSKELPAENIVSLSESAANSGGLSVPEKETRRNSLIRQALIEKLDKGLPTVDTKFLANSIKSSTSEMDRLFQIIGTTGLNSEAWQRTKQALQNGSMSFFDVDLSQFATQAPDVVTPREFLQAGLLRLQVLAQAGDHTLAGEAQSFLRGATRKELMNYSKQELAAFIRTADEQQLIEPELLLNFFSLSKLRSIDLNDVAQSLESKYGNTRDPSGHGPGFSIFKQNAQRLLTEGKFEEAVALIVSRTVETSGKFAPLGASEITSAILLNGRISIPGKTYICAQFAERFPDLYLELVPMAVKDDNWRWVPLAALMTPLKDSTALGKSNDRTKQTALNLILVYSMWKFGDTAGLGAFLSKHNDIDPMIWMYAATALAALSS